MLVPPTEEMHPEDPSDASRRLTPHLIGEELIWANRDDEEVDAELYMMELASRDD